MFFRKIVLAALLIGGAGHAQDAKDPLSKAQKLEALRKVLGSGSGPAAKTRRARSGGPPPDYRAQALAELKPDAEAYASGRGSSAMATVQTASIHADDPVTHQGLRVGLTFQPYRPEGVMPLVVLGDRDLSRLPASVMTGIELRYLPLKSNLFGSHYLGLRGGGAYATQAVRLRGPSGKDLGPTRLHSLQSYLLLSQEWEIGPRWSLSLDAGAGRFDLIQSGASALAQASDGMTLALLRAGPNYQLGSFWLGLAIEERLVAGGAWARLRERSVLFGVQYALR